jgi:anti-sigma factor RsiW
MPGPACRQFDALVTPYIDGEVTAAERAVVEAHLSKCPPCRRRAAAEAAVRETVRTRLCRPCAPEHLRDRCLAASRTRLSPQTFFFAASVFIVGGGVLMYGLTRLSPTVLAAQLMLDHAKCFAVDRPTTAVDTVETERQFERRHGWSVHLPRPMVASLQLVGIRQCFCAQGGATAHAMYRFEGRPVSLYILPEVNREPASADVFGHDAVIWSRNGNTYVLLGQEPDSAMRKLAEDFNRGL